MRLSAPASLTFTALALCGPFGCEAPNELTSGGSAEVLYTSSSSSGGGAPKQSGLLAAQLTGCEMQTEAPTGGLRAALPGTWLNYGEVTNLLAFDTGNEVALYTQSSSDPQRYEVSVRGRYTLGGDGVSVTWADGAVEENTAVVANVPGCVMLSFANRTPRLSSDVYFERMHCTPVPGAPTATSNPGSTNSGQPPPPPPSAAVVDAGTPDSSR